MLCKGNVGLQLFIYVYDSYVAVWMVMHYENMLIIVRMSGISISCSKRCSQLRYAHTLIK